ncbi:hypothetical protein C2E23DRAFT_881700 [Lenzites betulinus]|nr:hypothetical protein C2E23DRAFT_881700 [Lenzites betulinus]
MAEARAHAATVQPGTIERRRTHAMPGPPRHIVTTKRPARTHILPRYSQVTAEESNRRRHRAASTNWIEQIHHDDQVPPYNATPHLVQQPPGLPLSSQSLPPVSQEPQPVYNDQIWYASDASWTRDPTATATPSFERWPTDNLPSHTHNQAWETSSAQSAHKQIKSPDMIGETLRERANYEPPSDAQLSVATPRTRANHTGEFRGDPRPCDEYPPPAPRDSESMQEEAQWSPQQGSPGIKSTYHWLEARAMAMAGIYPEHKTPEICAPGNMMVSGESGWIAAATRPSPPDVAGAHGLDPANWDVEQIVARYLGTDWVDAVRVLPTMTDGGFAYAWPSYL